MRNSSDGSRSLRRSRGIQLRMQSTLLGPVIINPSSQPIDRSSSRLETDRLDKGRHFVLLERDVERDVPRRRATDEVAEGDDGDTEREMADLETVRTSSSCERTGGGGVRGRERCCGMGRGCDRGREVICRHRGGG
jgi:hypothetical protein